MLARTDNLLLVLVAGAYVALRGEGSAARRGSKAGVLLLAGALLYSAVGGLLVWYGFLASADVESLSGLRLLVFRVGGFVADGAARPLGADWWSQGALYIWLMMAAMLLLAAVAVGWFAAALRTGHADLGPVTGAPAVTARGLGPLAVTDGARVALVDLHRHLDGSIRLSTILDLGRQHDLPLPAWTGSRQQLLVARAEMAAQAAAAATLPRGGASSRPWPCLPSYRP